MRSVFNMLSSGAIPLELLKAEKIDYTTESGLTVQCNATDTFLIAQSSCDDTVVEGSHNPVFESRAYLVSGGKLVCEIYWEVYYSLNIGPGWYYQYYYKSDVILPDASNASLDSNYLFTAPLLTSSDGTTNKIAVKLS